MRGTSSVGGAGLYEHGDQKMYKESEINEAERYKEARPDSHLASDPKYHHVAANKLARQEKRDHEEDAKQLEKEQHNKDPTLPAQFHGNEPSRGAKIDKELQEDDEEILKKKGIQGTQGSWGSKQ